MADNDEISLLVKLATKGSEKVKSDIKSVKDSVTDLGRVNDNLNSDKIKQVSASWEDQRKRIADLRSEQQKFKADLDASIPSFEKEVQAVRNLNSEFDKLAASERNRVAGFGGEASAIPDVSGGSGINLSTIGGRLRQLPSASIPGTGLTTDGIANIIRAGGAVQQLSANSEGLKDKAIAAANAIGIGNIGMVGGIAALALVIKVLSDRAEEARKAAQGELDARAKAIGLLQTQNQQNIQARINEIAADKARNQAIADDANLKLAQLRQEIDARGKNQLALAEFNSNLHTGAGELTAAKENADKANKALDQTNTELVLLEQGSGLAAQTTEDLAKAEAALTLRRQAAALDIARVEDRLSAAKEAQQFIDSGTVEGLEKRKAGILAELKLIEQAQQEAANLFRANAGDPEKQKQYSAEVTKLTAQFDTLSKTYDALGSSTVELAVKNNDALKLNQEAQKDLDKIGADFANAETKRQSDLKSIADKTAESYRKLKESFDQANSEAVIKANEDLAKSARTRADEELKNQLELEYKLSKVSDDTKEAAIKAAISRNEAVAKIEQEYGRSRDRAIQDRDSVALDAANQKKSDELADAKKAYDKDIKQAADNAEKKRKDILADFEQQRKLERLQRAAQDRERDIAYDNEKAARKRQYQYQQGQIEATARAEILARNNAYIKTISDLQKFLQDYKDSHKGIYGDVLTYANKLAADIRKVLSGGGGSSGSIGGKVGIPADKVIARPGHLLPTEFHTGGRTRNGGWANLAPGELVLTPQQQSMIFSPPKQGGGVTFVLNGYGRAALHAEVDRKLDAFLDEAGY